MAGIKDLHAVWNNVKEMDLRPLVEQARALPRIAILGQAGSGRSRLAEQLRRDPARPGVETQSEALILDLEQAAEAAQAELILLIINPANEDASRELALAARWRSAGKNLLLIVNCAPGQAPAAIPEALTGWVEDDDFLSRQVAPAAVRLLTARLLALGRHFPLFRAAVAAHLINDACFSNAAYSLSTGLAEIAPVLGIPLNITDMVVLTKTQAFLVYKLGLALGLSLRWQDYVAEFGSVLGGGFAWRQAARQLVGLIPAWGIVPKVAVAYAGTYVVGHTVYRWYLTGRHITASQMRQLYTQAFARGKGLAQNLAAKLPRPRRKKKAPEALPAPAAGLVCAQCGKVSAADAQFCQYCGLSF
jgi:uncharacterized protein (DUF697 family)